MGRKQKLSAFASALLTGTVLSTGALAGGFDRGGVNVDGLFDESRFALDAQVSYVSPRRTVLNVQRSNNIAAPAVQAGVLIAATGAADLAGAQAILAGLAAAAAGGDLIAAAQLAAIQQAVADNTPAGATSARIEQDSSFAVPRFSAKLNVGQGLDCLATYSEPYGADNANGTGNALSASSVEFSIDTQDYGLTCGYEFGAGSTSVGDSFVTIVGGVSYQEFDGFLSRQSFLDFANAGIGSLVGVAPGANLTNTAGLGTFRVNDSSIGWRAGIAYEIPDIALRAFILYSSAYDYNLTGVQDNTGFGVDPTAANAFANISATTEIPQALDIRLQSGIAEGTLAFANFRWQDWSQLDIIPIQGGVTAVGVDGTGSAIPTSLAFEAGYQDGYTVNVGIGRQLSDNLSGLVSLGWDRGTSTVSGTQTDSWTLSGGLNYKEGENIEIRVGGAVGILEGGQSTALPNSIDQANAVSYEFDADLLLAVTGGVKYKF